MQTNLRFTAWCLVLAAIFMTVPARASLRALPGHLPAVVAHLTPIGRLAGTNRLHLAIGLPLRNQAALGQLLRELYDPASPNYHQYLTPAEFTARFGPTAADYQAVIEFARTNGLTVTRRHGNRVLLDVDASVADVEKAFHVVLRTYHHPTEARDFYAPDTEPGVDARLPVLDVSGLSDFSRATPFRHEQPATGPVDAAGSGTNGELLGQDFRNAYVPGNAPTGFGQMVGLVEFSGYDPDDIFAYEAQAGLPDVPLQNVLLDGTVGNEVANGDVESEVCLDIEMAMAMAPGLSAVVVYQAPYTNSAAWLNDILNTMVASNQVRQFSCSWGFNGTPNATSEQIFQQMAAQGQSFFQASGDGDAWTSPIWQPSESTNVTVVGGTTLTMSGTGGAYVSEMVWNAGNLGYAWGANGSTNDYWGSGGGVSGDNALPWWQAGLNMATNLGSSVMRNLPDVALTADNIYVTHGSGTSGSYGGTSCAAPLWAGFMALANQQAATYGRAPAGFANPAIYTLGQSTNYAACFNDITTGSNTWPGSPNLYYAVPGYDLCTGWGTPTGTNLINVLADGAPDPLVIEPLAGFVANGAAGGPFNGAIQTFSLNNPGPQAMNWSLLNTSVWLTASQWSGTLNPGGQTPVSVTLTAAANALPAGIYNATVWFTNTTTGAVQPRPFTIRAGQSLVRDGGFESGSFCVWTLYGKTTTNFGAYIFNGVESPHPAYNPVHSGNYGAFFGDSTLAVLSQLLPTYPGQKYLLSFWVINPTGGSGQQFQVNWNTNSPVVTNTIYSQANPGLYGWTNFNFVLTATATNTTLQLGAANPPNYFGLDDVSVTPIPAPSFATVAAATNGLALTWNTLAHVGYQLQYKTNLLQAGWISLGGAVTAGTNTFTLLDTNAPALAPERFYRVSVVP